MAEKFVGDYLKFLPLLRGLPNGNVWISFDKDADVLYVNFSNTEDSDDAELSDDDVIFRFKGDKIVGFTILHASKRSAL